MREGDKQTILREIPDGWKIERLKDISTFSNGKGHEQAIDDKGSYIVVNSKFISSDGKVKKYSNKNLCPLRKGEITMVMSDIPNGKAIAKCFIVDEDERYTLNQRICSINIKEEYDTIFMYYILNRNSYYLSFDNGVGQTNLRKDEVIDCPIQCPPLPEQQKIAKILSTVDNKIGVVDKQIKEMQELKKGLMQRLLTKGIGHAKFKDSALGKIPESWDVVKLDDFVNKVGSGVTPKGGQEAYLPEGINFIRSQNVLKGKLDITDVVFISEEQNEKMNRSQLQVNDVLLNITGASIGRSSVVPIDIIPANVNQHVCIIRCKDTLDHKYLCHLLNSSYGQNQINRFQAGGNREGLNFQQIRSFIIPFPALTEQQKIAETLTSIDNKKKVLTDKKTAYQELKKGLMQQLLTGKVRVNIN